MTQLQERVRRCAVAIPHRFFAGVLAASLLFITVYFLSGVLNTVSVTDSEGSSHSVITWQTDPTQLLKLAGVSTTAFTTLLTNPAGRCCMCSGPSRCMCRWTEGSSS